MATVRHLGFSYFRSFCHKFKLSFISTFTCSIWWRSDDTRPSYCRLSIFKMAAVRHLGFSYFCSFCQKYKLSLTSTYTGKLGEDRLICGRVIVYVRFSKWTWYDVIVDHPRPVFDGPNTVIKLHVDRVYILEDIAIFIFGQFGLKLLIHAPFGGVFGGYYPQMNSDIVVTPKRTVIGQKHVVWAINRKIHPRVWPGHVPKKKIQHNQEKSHKTVIFHLSGEKLLVHGLKWKFALV